MTAWPDGRVFSVTPGPDAPPPLREPVTVEVYAATPARMRFTLRVLAVLAARRYA